MLTVITPATATRLTTPETVEAELGAAPTGADVAFMMDAASDAVRVWCGRTFGVETVRETFDRVGLCASLTLSRWPIVDIVGVTVGNEEIALADVETNSAAGILSIGRRAAVRVCVTYRAGYVLPGNEGRTLPADIERATVLLIRSMWFGRGRDPMIRSEAVEGVSSISYQVAPIGTGSLPPEVEGLLSPHRQAVAA